MLEVRGRKEESGFNVLMTFELFSLCVLSVDMIWLFLKTEKRCVWCVYKHNQYSVITMYLYTSCRIDWRSLWTCFKQSATTSSLWKPLWWVQWPLLPLFCRWCHSIFRMLCLIIVVRFVIVLKTYKSMCMPLFGNDCTLYTFVLCIHLYSVYIIYIQKNCVLWVYGFTL